jgi:4-aminobutyrate aminotransferase-like enzyme
MYDECVQRGLLSMVYAARVRLQPALTIDRDTARNGIAVLREVFDLAKAEGFWRDA